MSSAIMREKDPFANSEKESHVKLVDLQKRFGDVDAVKDLYLDIERGSFTCLLGPSGCGKTTTLRMISGFVQPTHGDIFISGVSQEGVPPHKRNTSIVFQEYALFPHMTVEENVSYGLKIKRIPLAERKKKVEEVLTFIGLMPMAKRLPKFLSGGQQQRVALARSLVMEPEVILMDEPLSNLDAKLRVKVRTELKEIQRRLGLTTIYVTHDQEEALAMSDRIAVMKDGLLQQYGTPWDLYFEPANQFVADFIGANNFLKVTICGIEESSIMVRIGKQKLQIKRKDFNYMPQAQEEVILSIRPESIKVHGKGEELQKESHIIGEIRIHQFLGSVVRYWVVIEDQEIIIDDQAPKERGILTNQVLLSIETGGAQFFPIK